MTKHILIYTIILFSYSSFTQTFHVDTVRYWEEGNIDSSERKQGYWKFHRDIDYISRVSKGLSLTETQSQPLFEGNYSDDVKIGKWIYYMVSDTTYCWEQMIAPWYYITYYEDGSTLYEHVFGWRKHIFNSDSSSIEVELKKEVRLEKFEQPFYQKIHIYGIKTDSNYTCRLKTENDIIIDSFPFSELEHHIWLFEIGQYDKLIKNNR